MSRARPLVSVIVPTFNRAPWCVECVQSVLAQSMGDLEIIVVDDCSSDSTPSDIGHMAVADARVIYLRQEENRGGQAARNRGLSVAKGDFVNLLDSDDLLHPIKLERQLALLESRPEAELAVCQMAQFREQPEDASSLWNTLQGPDPLRRFLCHDIVWGIHAPLWRRSAIERLAPFDEALPVAQDYELHTRALISGLVPAIAPELLCYFRVHEGPALRGFVPERRLVVLHGLFRRFETLLRDQGRLTDDYRHELAMNCLWLTTHAGLIGSTGIVGRCQRSFRELEPSRRLRSKARLGAVIARALALSRRPPLFHALRRFYMNNIGDFSNRERWASTPHMIDEEPGIQVFPS